MKITFDELYGAAAAQQAPRYDSVVRGFEEYFGDSTGVSFFSAPGRTEVGGNHTDHNHGRVLAAAINLDIIAAAKKTDTGVIRLKSAEYEKIDVIDLSNLEAVESERETSASVIRGICARCAALGYKIGGFDAFTTTQVLKGSGLSSSAAFEVLVVTILNHLYNEDTIDPVLNAQISQYAENVYFGKPSGLMDQTASSVGGFTAIDFKDPTKPVLEKVDFDLDEAGYALCIVDTGGNHADLTGEYAAIPQEMKAVAACLGGEVLRDVDEEKLYANLAEIRAKTGDRAVLRAMHFFDDNRLAAEEAQALKNGDFELFKTLILKSGRSSAERLQNVFAVVNPAEQGLSLALAVTEKLLAGKGAAWRVHGGGFAGTIQVFVPKAEVTAYKEAIEAVFGKDHCYILSIRSAGGTQVLR